MYLSTSFPSTFFLAASLLSLPTTILAATSILSTSGVSSCASNGTVKVTSLDVTYDKDTGVLDFNVAGESTVRQNVTANMTVVLFGQEIFSQSFSPCDFGMEQMCPVPATSFASHGSQTIPEQFASQIPAIIFNLPNLDGLVKLQLTGDGGEQIGCIESIVGNGHTLAVPAVSYVAAAIAAAALAMTGIGSLASGGQAGVTTSSPTFTEVMGWFQGLAMNGMLSVQYPSVYRSFASNFAFSTGLVSWSQLQTSIDQFRAKTGGNLTDASYQYLRNNATLVYGTSKSTGTKRRRYIDMSSLSIRDGTDISLNGTTQSIGGSAAVSNHTATVKGSHLVTGVQAYSEQLLVPKANIFMTVLLVWCIVIAAIVVFILLLKVILEACAQMGKLPKSLESWRKRYWWRMAKALTNLVLLLYGSWTLYCIYQFTNGDSWAAQTLAGVTLAIFTAILLGFTWRIWSKANEYRKIDGDASKLYADKEVWIKYSLFYENYKQGYWWLFVPTIVYMFARGAIIAGANGHGLVQTAGQLVVEALMLILLLWTRPYQRRSGRWINIFIQVVRVLSVICILVFVEELGINQTTKTITGVVLIVVQSTLTILLAILIAINGIRNCIQENPHRRARKEAEKNSREMDNLTSLDPRNSLLMTSAHHRKPSSHDGLAATEEYSHVPRPPGFSVGNPSRGRYDVLPTHNRSLSSLSRNDDDAGDLSPQGFARPPRFRQDSSASDRANLLAHAASHGHGRAGWEASPSTSPPPHREPRLPNV